MKKKALVLAAGIGTRLSPLTLAVPKPMVYILNQPVMLYNIELLKNYGFKDIIANLHYFPEQIENFFRDGARFGVNISYSYEEKLLGTAGGVRKMGREIDEIKQTFVVLSSDALSDINLDQIVKFHKKKRALATMALKKLAAVDRFGVAILDQAGKVTAFQEKPAPGKELSKLVNAGIYVFEPQVLDLIPRGEFCDFARQVFPRMLKENLGLYGFEISGYWSDIGSLSQYKQTQLDVLRKKVKVKIPYKEVVKNRYLGEGAKIHKEAVIEPYTVVGSRAKLGKGVHLKQNSILGEACILRDYSVISDSLIWSESLIGENCRISGSIIGNWCYLEDGVEIGPDSIIGNRCHLKSGTKIPPGTNLKPDQII